LLDDRLRRFGRRVRKKRGGVVAERKGDGLGPSWTWLRDLSFSSPAAGVGRAGRCSLVTLDTYFKRSRRMMGMQETMTVDQSRIDVVIRGNASRQDGMECFPLCWISPGSHTTLLAKRVCAGMSV
jgi:hypothetical protein